MSQRENFINNFNYCANKKNLYENLYEILEVSQKATKTDIKKSYKKLILKYHPDKNNQNTSEKFLEIKNAYDILYDDDARELYDKFIAIGNLNQFSHFNLSNPFEYFSERKINELLIKFINSTDIEKIIIILTKKKIYYNDLNKLFLDSSLDNLKNQIVNINITINFCLKDLWYGNSKKISYKRVTKEIFNEEIFPFDQVQIYDGEGEKIKFDNMELNGNLTININITDTKINGEQYYIYENELYVLVDSNRIKNDKFILNFLDGNNYKFNLSRLNQIKNKLGKFYVKKNFGLINNNETSHKININCDNYYYTHGNLYFIILI
jgi:curved DNA-binding protein CbpA